MTHSTRRTALTGTGPTSASEARLLRFDVSDRTPIEGARELAGELERAAEDGRFAAVIELPSVVSKLRLLGSAAELVRIAKRMKPLLQQNCLGLAVVLSAESQAANAKAIRKGMRFWGGPSRVTDDPAKAMRWAESWIAEGGLTAGS